MSGDHWGKIQRRAKNRGLEFTITIEEAWDLFQAQEGRCALSGAPIKFARSQKSGVQTASLDRRDSTKGYVTGNIQWVHKIVNMMKNTLTDEEFIEWCKTIATFSSGKSSCLPSGLVEPPSEPDVIAFGTPRSEKSQAA